MKWRRDERGVKRIVGEIQIWIFQLASNFLFCSFFMARKYIRRYIKSVGKSNWSHENKGCQSAFGGDLINGLYQAGSIVVPASTNQGTRTVGNWSITVPVTTAGSSNEFYWALVYVPQGETAKNLFATTGTLEGSLYEPNQYVIASGISDGNAGPIRIRSRMLRKLHSNDFISLIVGTDSTQVASTPMRALVSYSIKYN